MAKVSRSMLKSIVKECLVEILAEGLSGGDTQELNESLQNNYTEKSQKSTRMNSAKGSSTNKVVNPNFEDKTKQIISNATSDPVMASLLEDTAKTTLQEQNSADSSKRFVAKSNDAYSQIAGESDPMELFGGVSNNWASLAFSDAKS